ncbi:hypothetical protein OsI_28880 [Oryza sativa Indica Group]|uniref:DUF630 domain-containing protein n=3 Tax=Oryza TaxID=4527 RepID=B8B9W0_ORYSI|nr:hypothetical protein OsI_28880 [Oryza sativa Indica Group]
MKSVVQARNAFAAVHSAYAMSLRDTGAALFEFAHGEGVLPPPPPPPTTTGPRGRRRAPWDHTTREVAAMEETSSEAADRSLYQKAAAMVASYTETYRSKPLSFWLLLVLSAGAMLTAFPASSLLSRLYYNNGGQSKWILSWSAVAG